MPAPAVRASVCSTLRLGSVGAVAVLDGGEGQLCGNLATEADLEALGHIPVMLARATDTAITNR